MLFLLVKDTPQRNFELFERAMNPSKINLTKDQYAEFKSKFLSKARLYFDTMALWAILNAKRKDQRYDCLLAEFEKLVMPPEPTSAGLRRLADIKDAMADIEQQIIKNAKVLPWCRNWLLDIGLNETNPYTLMMLVQIFRIHFNSYREFIQDAHPHV